MRPQVLCVSSHYTCDEELLILTDLAVEVFFLRAIGLGLLYGPTDVVIHAIGYWKRVVAWKGLVQSFVTRNSCSLSLSKILSFSICTSISCNSSFLLSIIIAVVHPGGGVLFLGRHPVMLGVSYAGVACYLSVRKGIFVQLLQVEMHLIVLVILLG